MAHPPFTRDLSYSLQKKRGVKAPFFPMLDKRFWIYNFFGQTIFLDKQCVPRLFRCRLLLIAVFINQ